MKIAIFTSGTLPVPAVQGGAVENLLDELLLYNEQHKLHDITVFSIAPKHPLPKIPDTKCNHYVFVNDQSLWAKIKRRLLSFFHKKGFYYNYFIEYYLHESLRHFRKQHFDVVILESRPGYASRIKACSSSKVIVHLHYDWLSQDDNTKLLPQLQVCDKIITVSDFIKNQIACVTNGVSINTVHNGIDTKIFFDAKGKDRSELGFKKDDIILVYSGRIYPDKGVAELIEAFLLLKEYNQLKLLIIGESIFEKSNQTDPYIVRLKSIAATADNRIIFTGFIPYSEIPSYLKMSNIAVVPSLCNEAFSMAVLEAMACGLPIIATRSGGIPEPAGKDNLLIDNNSFIVENLRDAIKKLIDNPSLCSKIGNANIQRSRLFDKAVFAKKFFESLMIDVL